MAPTGKAAAPLSKKKSLSFSAALAQTPQQDPRRIDLTGHRPPIDTLDPALQDLKSLRQLSLSTNAISSIQNIPEKLELLSLGRNAIKRLDGVGVATALEQLWISYNHVDSLKGVETLRNLKVLYASNNMISSWDEIDRLSHLEHLTDVLFIGNPLHTKYHNGKGGIGDAEGPATYVREMCKRLKHLKKLDGKLLGGAPDECQVASENAADAHPNGCCK